MWGRKTFMEDVTLYDQWMKAHLLANYIKGATWILEMDKSITLSDITCTFEISDDGYLLFSTNIEEQEKKIREAPFVDQRSWIAKELEFIR